MKKISKLLVGILFSALVVAPSYAGELAVTGSAKANYALDVKITKEASTALISKIGNDLK